MVGRERVEVEKLLSELHAFGRHRPVYYHPVVNIYDVPLNRKGRHKTDRGAGRNLRLQFIKGPGYLFLKYPLHGATGSSGRPYGPIVILYRVTIRPRTRDRLVDHDGTSSHLVDAHRNRNYDRFF